MSKIAQTAGCTINRIYAKADLLFYNRGYLNFV